MLCYFQIKTIPDRHNDIFYKKKKKKIGQILGLSSSIF